MDQFRRHLRLLPDVIEIAIGAAIALLYLVFLAPILPSSVRIGTAVLPGSWLFPIILMVCLIPLQRPIRRFLVQWLAQKGWHEDH